MQLLTLFHLITYWGPCKHSSLLINLFCSSQNKVINSLIGQKGLDRLTCLLWYSERFIMLPFPLTMPAKQEKTRNNIICACVLQKCMYAEHLNVFSTQEKQFFLPIAFSWMRYDDASDWTAGLSQLPNLQRLEFDWKTITPPWITLIARARPVAALSILVQSESDSNEHFF